MLTIVPMALIICDERVLDEHKPVQIGLLALALCAPLGACGDGYPPPLLASTRAPTIRVRLGKVLRTLFAKYSAANFLPV